MQHSTALHEKKDKEYVEKTIVLNSESESLKRQLSVLTEGKYFVLQLGYRGVGLHVRILICNYLVAQIFTNIHKPSFWVATMHRSE